MTQAATRVANSAATTGESPRRYRARNAPANESPAAVGRPGGELEEDGVTLARQHTAVLAVRREGFYLALVVDDDDTVDGRDGGHGCRLTGGGQGRRQCGDERGRGARVVAGACTTPAASFSEVTAPSASFAVVMVPSLTLSAIIAYPTAAMRRSGVSFWKPFTPSLNQTRRWTSPWVKTVAGTMDM